MSVEISRHEIPSTPRGYGAEIFARFAKEYHSKALRHCTSDLLQIPANPNPHNSYAELRKSCAPKSRVSYLLCKSCEFAQQI